MAAESQKKKILFVDDEERVLSGLKRLLHAQQEKWQMRFTNSGQDAFQIMAEEDIDLIVTDLRMPDVDGIELLKRIKAAYPTVLRIGLSGTADEHLNLAALHLVHQYLPKPCQRDTLIATLERSIALKNVMENESLKEIIPQLTTLPSLPAMYYEIIDQVNSEDSSIRDIGKIVSKDISMSTKVLQLINSAYFGMRREVTDPIQAVIFLGLNTIKSLVLTIKIFASFEENNIDPEYINQLWSHSLTVANYTQAIAKAENLPRDDLNDYLTAGLLHDVGKLVIAANFPQEFQQIFARSEGNGQSLLKAEKDVLGSTHSEIGAYLLGLWGLPTPLISSCAFHHYPERYKSSQLGIVNVVHAADVIEHQQRNRETSKPEHQFKHAYFESLNLNEQLESWEELCSNLE